VPLLTILFLLAVRLPASRAELPRTVAETSDYQATSRHADVVAFCERLARESALVRVGELGESHEGRKLPLLVLADPPVATPEAAARSGKLVVFALGNIHASPREFFRLAALQIRRELIDLARHHFGLAGAARPRPQAAADQTPMQSPGALDPSDSTLDPRTLAEWGEFHEQIGRLPEEEREVFDLLWYQGLTHAEAAELLQLSTKTIQRRWQAACLRLHEAMQGHMPGL
jgi:RNA polymerase sigma factor (sigma-70 family)